ncbi:basic proline-rich protein-like isoform X2 [Takifugu flavidus]|uniref:basic proline-rich protein-like isoform X2 n=1 Tax=Takifugu flavidus TaxID=433684 RepID=UPI0025449C8E|nr:basic proline-rich protein-like isoform X2 [Takifugu flavidus]
MAATLVLSGVCLFALLIGDICCVPVQKGNDPAAYDDSYRHAAPSYDPQPGPRSGPGFGPQPGPGFGPQPGPGFGPQSGQGLAPPVAPQSGPGYGPEPGPEPGPRSGPEPGPEPGPRPGPGYGPQPGPGYGPGFGPPVWPGFGPPPVAPQSGHYPLGSVSEGGSSPYYYPEMKPGYDQPSEYIRPPIPQPAYQGGELTHYEDSAEHGFYERESDEQGQFPHPPHIFASPKMVSSSMPHPLPPRPVLPQWGFYPYYYDYRFITGQYPPGTYTHASANFEHGRDAWQDVHYRQ